MNITSTLDNQRRHFVASALALAGTTLLASKSHSQLLGKHAATAHYIASARSGINKFNAVLLDINGDTLHQVKLPERAHGAATHRAKGLAVVFARRPGYYLCCLNFKSLHTPLLIQPSPARHFYGHGVYSDNGSYLLATENDIDTGQGVIGIYAVDQGYRKVGELDTHGIGPHEIISIPDQPLIVVANGGIRTHPDTGRQKLNIENMQPSLSIIDTRDGKLVGYHRLPDDYHQLSIRHLTFTRNGNIWFAGQYEGDNSLPDSLAGSVSLQASLASFKDGKSRSGALLSTMPQSLIERTKGYLSSVAAFDQTVAFTSSRGGIAFMLDDSTGTIIDITTQLDCSGIASASPTSINDDTSKPPQETMQSVSALPPFIITGGTGDLQFFPQALTATTSSNRYQWDNHIYRV